MEDEEKISFKETIEKAKQGDGDEVSVEEKLPLGRRDRFLPASIIIAAVLIGGSVLFAALYRPGASTPSGGAGNAGAPAANGGAAQAPSAAVATAPAPGSRDVILGNASAPATVIEYGDYQCPFCVRFYEQVQPLVIQNYVNAGKAKLVFRDFPFLDSAEITSSSVGESHAAGAAAECAKDENQFWPYHDALYAAKAADEAKGGGEDDGFFNRALFLKIAGQLSMNTTAFASCIDSGKYTATVNADYTAAMNAGVNSTPMTFVNGKEVTDALGQSVGANGTAVLAAIAAAIK
ncbi:MAG: thioredoxin domain-containing protein [Minisyncoccia bacterium]|jgi:protein-disulfide isomerase